MYDYVFQTLLLGGNEVYLSIIIMHDRIVSELLLVAHTNNKDNDQHGHMNSLSNNYHM